MPRRLSVNPAQKFEPFLMTMHWPITLPVAMSSAANGDRHGAGQALLHQQTRLRAVDRLDLALFVN